LYLIVLRIFLFISTTVLVFLFADHSPARKLIGSFTFGYASFINYWMSAIFSYQVNNILYCTTFVVVKQSELSLTCSVPAPSAGWGHE